MKKIMILMMCLMMCACSNETVNPNNDQDINACDVLNPCDTTLSSADENLKWEKISLLESLDYAKGTVILFYSFTDCPYCIEARPILEEVLEGSDIPVYYVDVAREERNVDNENYLAVYNHFKDIIEGQGYDKIYMPSVFFIKDGEVLGMHVGTVDNHNPKEALMNETQVAELSTIYTNYYVGQVEEALQ